MVRGVNVSVTILMYFHQKVISLQGKLQSLSEHLRVQDHQDKPVCEDCQKVVRFIDNALKTGEKLEEFKSTLKLLCDMLPHDEQQSVRGQNRNKTRLFPVQKHHRQH